jgi:hypothetical protein
MSDGLRGESGERSGSGSLSAVGNAGGEAGATAAPPSLNFATVAFARRAGKYLLRTDGGALLVELRKASGTVDGRAGMVGPASIITFANRRIGMLNAVVLDLDGDGIELKSRKKADARFDMDGDGIGDDTGWVGKNDGILVVDRNGDQRIDAASEITFVADMADALSGLHGLSSFDANRDGKVDAADARFAELKLWVDRNGDGIAGEGEVRSLADHNIRSIALDPVATSTALKLGANAVTMTSTFERTDGSTGTIGDAMLAFSPSGTPGEDIESSGSGGLEGADSVAGAMAPRIVDDLDPAAAATGPQAAAQAPVAAPRVGPAAAATIPSASPGAGAVASDGLDYAVRVEAANGRLIQAMGSFGAAGSAAHHPSAAAAPDQPDWLTVASLPSVQNMLSVGPGSGI